MWVCQAWMLYVEHCAKSLVCINPTASLLKCLLFSIKCTMNVAHFLFYFSSGVERKFGVGVGRMEWLESENLWSLTGLDGQNLGHFQGVVASDKNIVSSRFTSVTGRPPPLGMMSLWHSFFWGGITMSLWHSVYFRQMTSSCVQAWAPFFLCSAHACVFVKFHCD